MARTVVHERRVDGFVKIFQKRNVLFILEGTLRDFRKEEIWVERT